jgi:hypothetical protein
VALEQVLARLRLHGQDWVGLVLFIFAAFRDKHTHKIVIENAQFALLLCVVADQKGAEEAVLRALTSVDISNDL